MVKKLILLVCVPVLTSVLSANVPQEWFSAKTVSPGVWMIGDHGADNLYLIEGTDSAMLIDTGFGRADIASFVKRLTNKPLIVLNTHGHPDHAGGNYQFPRVYIHAADADAAKSYNIPHATDSSSVAMLGDNRPADNELFKGPAFNTILVPVKEGKIFDLGGRRIQVMETPGHSPGAICLLDIENKLLFTGDNNNLLGWLFLGNSLPLHVYLSTLEKQATRLNEFTTICPGHWEPMDSGFINDQIECVKGILNKTLESKPYESFAGNGRVSTFGKASIAFNPENL